MTERDLTVMMAAAFFSGLFAILSTRQKMGIGRLLNPLFLLVPEEERASTDKRPYYKQAANLYFLLSTYCVVLAVSIFLQSAGIRKLLIPLAAGTAVYIYLSSERIKKGRG